MAHQASEKCSLLPPDHKQIAYCTSRSINVELLAGILSLHTISSLPPQTSSSLRWKQFDEDRKHCTALFNPSSKL